jgi:hypothetical protein
MYTVLHKTSNILKKFNVPGVVYQCFAETCCFHLPGRRMIYPEDGGSRFVQNIGTDL